MGKNLFNKVWENYTIKELPSGKTQLLIGLHLIHEVTSPQAFSALKKLKLKVAYPGKTFATVDHIIPTDTRKRPLRDELAEEMIQAIKENCEEHKITFFGENSENQGIVHVIGPELGLSRPGITIACGDSHTSTHGAFGSIAFGIGTTQVRDVLATQTLALKKLKVRQIKINGKLKPGVYAKDIILNIVRKLGVQGGIGYAYEFAGETIEGLSMEERMTVCNMSIEGGARVGYINPDQTTFKYLENKEFIKKEDWSKLLTYWKSIASDQNAEYDDQVELKAEDFEPTVTWGINPGQAITINESVPDPKNYQSQAEQDSIKEALKYMKFVPGLKIKEQKIDVAFIGSCTNGRLEDLIEVSKYLKDQKVASWVKALVVPGSVKVKREAEALGIDQAFIEAGFEWREPGCSMCLAMNPDKLEQDQICASSSNRNFKGRQGSPTGRTVLMSPVMVAAAAIKGVISDAREVFGI